MYNKIGVIGNKDSVAAFRAIGVEVFDATSPEEARLLIRDLSQDGFAVIYIAENLAEKIPDTIERCKRTPYPVLVPIPLEGKGTGYGMRNIKKDVEKAIGIDILFNKEEEKECKEE